MTSSVFDQYFLFLMSTNLNLNQYLVIELLAILYFTQLHLNLKIIIIDHKIIYSKQNQIHYLKTNFIVNRFVGKFLLEVYQKNTY